ncbi:ISAs1 family transposase [Nostocales cyanobacterium LEGE 11386]|nr:ISAs1 family transposase [Nostocales cyanobacterium LEGE 11386]
MALNFSSKGDFVKRHRRVLIEKFALQKHGVPSYSTIRRVVMGVDFDKLVEKFHDWAQNYVELEELEWCAIDGKSIKSTVKNASSSSQKFVSIVTVFACKRGLVVGMERYENQHKSEILVVQELITALGLQDVVFSFDSLHYQKNWQNNY